MKKLLSLLLFVLVLFSCQNEASIQEYFIENADSKDFTSLDFGSEIINTEKLSLTSEDKKALQSFEKINILAFNKNNKNLEKYKVELKKVKTILKDTISYKRLIKVGTVKEGASIFFVGNENHIDEYIVFANNKENGFAVVRVLGKDMNPTNMIKILSLMQKSKMDSSPFEPLNVILK